jgi:tRNA(Ile)-lysidine synthase
MENSRNRPIDPVAAVAACIDRHAVNGQRLIVGLSGGIDSVVLLHTLRAAAASRQLALAALHIHHGLSSNADAWLAHCRALCAGWDIPFFAERVAVERDSADGLEAAARRARHEAYARASVDWVVLGHHRDDQAETLLFNLMRGTGLRGAGAMSERKGRLLRPLLGVGRVDIERYARAHELRWIEDESNADTGFSRNYLRHNVLAGLEKRFPGSTANMAAATARFAEAERLLDDLARLDLAGHDAVFPLDVAVLAALPEPRARNVLRHLLQQHQIGIPGDERLRELLRQLIHAAPDRHPSAVFATWRILRRRGKIVVESAQGA